MYSAHLHRRQKKTKCTMENVDPDLVGVDTNSTLLGRILWKIQGWHGWSDSPCIGGRPSADYSAPSGATELAVPAMESSFRALSKCLIGIVIRYCYVLSNITRLMTDMFINAHFLFLRIKKFEPKFILQMGRELALIIP